MKYSPFITAVLIFFAYSIVLASFSSDDLPTHPFYDNFFPYLADKPISEDGFYMLTVARNISEGMGFTYNSEIETTGVQPLGTIVFAGIAVLNGIFGGDEFSYLRLIIIFSALLQILFFLLIYKLLIISYPKVCSNNIKLFSIIFALLNFELFILFTNGLETGLYLLLIVITVYASFSIEKTKNFRTFLLFSTAAGFTVLARVDFLFPVLIFTSYSLYKRKIDLKQFSGIWLIILLIMLPWNIYVFHITGSIIQSSAAAQTSYIINGLYLERIREILRAFMEAATPGVYFGQKFIALITVALLALAAYYLHRKKFKFKISETINDRLRIWVLSFFLMAMIYLLISSAPYFYLRYTSPLHLIVLFSLLPLFDHIIKSRSVLKKLAAPLFLGVFFIQAFLYFHSGKLAVRMSMRPAYIKTHFEQNTKIGTFQSGVTGYFCSNVYNLDGKIDHNALQYGRLGKIGEYIDKQGMDVLIEWGEAFEGYNEKYFKENWVVHNDDIGDGKTTVLIRK